MHRVRCLLKQLNCASDENDVDQRSDDASDARNEQNYTYGPVRTYRHLERSVAIQFLAVIGGVPRHNSLSRWRFSGTH